MFYTKGDEQALFAAIKQGNLEAVTALIQRGTNIEARNEYNNTPLYEAVYHQQFIIARFLLNHQADVNAHCFEKKTPLIRACCRDSIEIVKLLLEYHPDLAARDNWGRTALHKAAEQNFIAAIVYLYKQGANLEATDGYKRTPLHLAATSNASWSIKFLLALGANIHATDSKGRTPLHLAERENATLAISILVNKNANSEAKDANNQTPKRVGKKHEAMNQTRKKNFQIKNNNDDNNNNNVNSSPSKENKKKLQGQLINQRQSYPGLDEKAELYILEKVEEFNKQGLACYRQQLYRDAITPFKKALKLIVLLLNDKYTLFKSNIIYNLASTEMNLNNFKSAQRRFFKAVDLKREVLGPNDPNTLKALAKRDQCIMQTSTKKNSNLAIPAENKNFLKNKYEDYPDDNNNSQSVKP